MHTSRAAVKAAPLTSAVLLTLGLAACSHDEGNQDSAQGSFAPSVASVPSSAANSSEETPRYDEVVSADGFLDEDQSVAQISTTLAGQSYFWVMSEFSVGRTATAPEPCRTFQDMPDQPWCPFTGRPKHPRRQRC